jgi:crotonobetainyl-CoA:carnitine CoA-transferase CaiB-like acyl-CoA transferase
LLALAGIEVLKIESPDRPDGARRGPPAFFDLLNANKEGCALDLRATPDREIFERLLETADLVLESARPRALEQLGYDPAGWLGSRPGRLWISITGYGRGHPERDWVAYGDDAAIAAGLAWPPAGSASSGPASEGPCFCADAIADPLTGLHAAAIALALTKVGRGGLLDLSLVDVAARAAGLSAGALVRPIERGAGTDSVIVDGARIEIAAPRARIATGSAPRLAPPCTRLLSKWTSRSARTSTC